MPQSWAQAADPTPIESKYASLPAATAAQLGAATGPESCTLRGGGCFVYYEGGRIVWSEATGAHVLVGAAFRDSWYTAFDVQYAGYPVTDTFCGLRDGGCGLHTENGSLYQTAGATPLFVPGDYRDVWARTGWENGPLGYPAGGAACQPVYQSGWCGQTFEHGVVLRTDTGVHPVWGAAYDLWKAHGFQNGGLGWPTSRTFCGLRDGGCGTHFEGGSVYTSPASGTHVLAPDVVDAWGATGWESGPLGYPVGEEVCELVDDGCLQRFQRGNVYVSPTGAFAVSGAILDRWGAHGWENGSLGYPTSAPFCGLRDGGCGQHFEGGSIYWSRATGAHAVGSELWNSYAAAGWERGALGYPTGAMFCGLRDHGCGQHFQGGSIYRASYHPRGTGYIVSGNIRNRWAAGGWENGQLGMPMGNAFCGLRDGACGQHFHGGSVYATRAGTFAVLGSVKTAWGEQGWEHGVLGFPTSDGFCGLRDGGCGQHFQGGSLYAAGPVTGFRPAPAYVVSGAFRTAWAARGWENGSLGYPVGNVHQTPGGPLQWFQRGSLQLRNGRVY
ncbi:hypothetical protein [Blastococcus saxobsidens]|uniref:hypothetical protein n=1 Tax=Blastococcus saxobsidens TaxID=138336 RepID=UPI0030FDFD14